jgi:hypothetical protein
MKRLLLPALALLLLQAPVCGLELKLTVPKSEFALGERIPVTITGSGDTGGEPWQVWYGCSPVAESMDALIFRGTATDGQPVKDPYARERRRRSCSECPHGQARSVQGFSETVPLNAYLRFERPGTYEVSVELTAQSPNALPLTDKTPDRRREIIRSAPLTLTIGPARPVDLAALAKRARSHQRETFEPAIQELSYLATPEARETLLDLLDDGGYSVEELAILSQPDPQGTAANLLARITSGRLMATQGNRNLYASLVTREQAVDYAVLEKVRHHFDETVGPLLAQKGGPAYLEYVLTSLLHSEKPLENPLRERLVRDQLQLTGDQFETLTVNWRQLGGPDLLPIVKQAMDQPHSTWAKHILVTRFPNEARPYVIEAFKDPEQRFLSLYDLPREVIPELQPWFQAELAKPNPDYDRALRGIDRYGAPDLLPGVIDLLMVRQWTDESSQHKHLSIAAGFTYWLRLEPDAGAQGLRGYLEKSGKNPRLVERILQEEWFPTLEPLLGEYLASDDPKSQEVAISALARWADVKWLEPCLSTCEKLPRQSEEDWRRLKSTQFALRSAFRWREQVNFRDRLEALEEVLGSHPGKFHPSPEVKPSP